VEICGSPVTSIKVPVSASLQDIITRVAEACKVQENYVKVSVDGRRATILSQVCGKVLLPQWTVCRLLLCPMVSECLEASLALYMCQD
jgi:hypothetical protein